ncbi:TonB-dependent receptor [Chitinophaga silvisoli]|uniref:TonB-dependent receptor n=1 Tax=Chitinophaga silvisoli TaxID=2291814 RepID=A0A3E1NYC4_9BACT|nr:TonB-dependent receptor [Chitinophaga silvisoli]RFM32946.1 TonB-dependent receptor [Chitinophaga silvisoli]
MYKPFSRLGSAVILLCGMTVNAQTTTQIRGIVTDNTDQKHIPGATVVIVETGLHAGSANIHGVVTGETGEFTIANVASGEYMLKVTSTGYEALTKKIKVIAGNGNTYNISLKPDLLNLSEITVSAATTRPGENKMDLLAMQLQPVKSAQDLLRTVPGLFIAQHAGGGKAEQIFVRGTDNDHGTDFAIFFDDIPVNMPSHAHGQGYADMHFMIPEVVGRASFFKGPYDAGLGDFSISGAAQFQSLYKLDRNVAKVEYGRYNSPRGLVMLHSPEWRNQNAYIAADYSYNDGYFIHKLHFKRLNLFGRYNVQLSPATDLSVTASGFNSSWDASGQLPLRAINAGKLNRYGSIDPSEGGSTSRVNLSIKTSTKLGTNGTFNNMLYYTKNNFSLYSDFTFFMTDTIHGDEIRQWEARDLFGYKGTYKRFDSIGHTALQTEVGLTTRTDLPDNGRDHVEQRVLLSVDAVNTAQITNYSFYIKENWQFHPRWHMQLGLRNDLFDFNFQDKLDKSNDGSKVVYRFNPKLHLYYDMSGNVTLYAKAGTGFHSNFIQAVVSKEQPANPVPTSYGGDLGTNFKIGQRALFSITGWMLYVGSEYRFVADDGSFEEIGNARKIGMDASIRYQLSNALWADVNLNYAHGVLRDAPKDANQLPLHPKWNSTGGLTYRHPSGLNASLRYRYMGERPATEDGSVQSASYFITDAVVKFTHPRYEIGIYAENLFNTQWAEAQFYDESKLKGEAEPVYDFHITPGTPLFIKGSLSVYF